MGYHEAIALHCRLEMPAAPSSPTNKRAKCSEEQFELSINAEQELREEDFIDFSFVVGEQEFWEQGFEDETEFDDSDFMSEIQTFQY